MRNTHLWVAFTILGGFVISFSIGGNVLVFPMDGSHWVNMKVLLNELISRGHNLTVIRSTHSWYIPEQSPQYHTITIHSGLSFESFFEDFLKEIIEVQRGNATATTFFKVTWKFITKVSEANLVLSEMLAGMLDDSELMARLKNDRYDLMLLDPAMGAGLIVAHYLKLPVVMNTRWVNNGEGHSFIAPSPLSYIPAPGSGFSDRMSFIQRVKNVLFHAVTLLQQKFVIGPHYERICERFFESQMSCDVINLAQSADIWLMRVDFVFEFPRPTMPNVVYIGGFQCKPPKPLPLDLEAFVQSAGEHGVIVMSMGTLVKGLPDDLADQIAEAFAALPQKVIWRHLGRRPPTLGNNTLLVEWMPQNDLLGDPRTRVFVAHGGTNGVQEAIYHGVPVLGIPLFFDQLDNLVRLQEKGTAIILELSQLNRQSFGESLSALIHGDTYSSNMERLSRLHKDTPMKPLDSALFWLEYVMHHKGAPHLRTQAYSMPWYSYHSIDVLMLLLVVAVTITVITVAFVRFLCVRIFFKSKIKRE